MITGINEERGRAKIKQGFFFFGMALTVIFGGGFLIRYVRDGEFYIAEFIGGVIGFVFLIAAMLAKNGSGNINHKD
jgi:hypothetical protein